MNASFVMKSLSKENLTFMAKMKMVFCYKNCSDLLREKIVLVNEKTFEIEDEGKAFAIFLRSLKQ